VGTRFLWSIVVTRVVGAIFWFIRVRKVGAIFWVRGMFTVEVTIYLL